MQRTWLSFVMLFVALFTFLTSQAQTTLISPSGDGGFELGSTFADNGWTAVNASTDGWAIGTAPVVAAGTKCGYVSANGGTAWTYSQLSTYTHIYKDVTIPAGESILTLKFKWKAKGEGTTSSDYDNMKVFIATTTVTPVTTAAVSGATNLSGPGATNGMYKLNDAAWNSETIILSGTPGTTYRLIFSWKSDGTDIVNPPAALDEISLISRAPGDFISVATGNWSAGATWDAGFAPTSLDNAKVSTGHVVTADNVNNLIKNLTVEGTLAYASAASSVTVGANLTVNSGGLINVFNGTTGKSLIVAGNITNNGRIDVSVGSTTAGALTLNGTAVQTVSGTGTFGGTVISTGTTNTADVIRNLILNNTSTAIPNIIWSFNNIKVAYNLTFTNAKVNLGNNKMIFGNYAAGNTLTATAPNGIMPGGKFSRWWTTGATGTSFTAGTDPSNGTSRYPFINPMGLNRAMYITRTNATGAVAGELAVVYTDDTTNNTGLSVADGAYTVTERFNGNWTVSNEGTAVSSSSYLVALLAPNTLYPSNGNARVMAASAAISGTHQNGTNTPGAQRTGVSQTDLLAGPLFIGIAASDIPFVSTASGNWNATTTWNKGTLPTCTDNVTIASGHNVTVNSETNESKGVTITTGGTLTIASGDLKVGCTNNNNNFTNNGTLTVSGGTLNINGNYLGNVGATLNQSGGDINVDGNAAGVTANSVASGTHLFNHIASAVANLNLTGGRITIVDPHTSTSSSDYVFRISQGGAYNSASANHTLRFGDGISNDNGGNTTYGFYYYLYPGSYLYGLGNLEINAGTTGTNRWVYNGTTYLNGNLNIVSGELRQVGSSITCPGNITNNGIYTNGTTLTLGLYNGSATVASNNTQTISGSGVFRNLITAETANLSSLTVNNSNATGVTLNIPLSISGTLTMTSGLINTTNTNLLKLGTASVAGTLSGIPSATNMVKGPFARTIASGNANTNFIMFPVGKSAYTPIELAPATTAVTVMKAEAFDSNTGTSNASIINMTTGRRWEAPVVSGTVTNVNVRLTDANILATSIPVQASAAAGEYNNVFGSVATATAGVNTKSNMAVLSANYTGFLSFADSNACSGTPTPGNTIPSVNSICLGTSVNLSLENVVSGSGVTYQWKSSTDGTTYTAITGATNATLTVTPTLPLYYKCEVTCSTGPATGSSTAVQITFANSITATTPATRCGIGTVSLAATANSGATVKWYAAETGGVALGSGATFTTPNIAATTTYYAGAETGTAGNVTLGTGTNTLGTDLSAFNNYRTSAKYQMIYTATELAAIGLYAGDISSIAYYVTSLGDAATNPNYTVKIGTTTLASFANTTFTTPTLTTCYGPSTYTHTASGWQTINFTTPFTWDGTSNIIIEVSQDGANLYSSASTRYTATTGNTVLYSYNGANNTLSSNRFNVMFNGQVACSSSRTPVVATVTTPPTLTLNTNSTTICSGSTSSAITISTGASDYDTYNWTPATGVTGNSTTGWTFNPTISTVYTLNASQSTGTTPCNNIVTFPVTVNAVPADIAITPASASICVDTIQKLEAAPIDTTVTRTVGTATTISGNTSLPTAFCNRFDHYWGQMVFTAAELNALGINAGNITALKFNITTQGSATNVTDFKLRIGTTANTTLSTFVTTGLTTVFSTATYNHVVGENTITFQTPYTWDGTSNIVVDIRQTGIDSTNNATTYYTATTGNTVLYAVTSTPVASSDAYAESNPSPSTSVNRLNTTFVATNALPSTITWSPATNLYTDATATTPYTTGTVASSVYVKSTSAVTTTYTATATANNSCTKTKTVEVVVKPNTTLTLTSATGTDAQTVCINTAFSDITYNITTATGASVTGLPDGVTGSYANGVFTISGTPTASGTFNYTITPSGGCGTATATGSIVVKPNATLTLSSATGTEAQTVCIDTALTDITYNITTATGATVTGLPAGVTGSYASGVFTISGTPTESGTFDYILTPSNGCGTVAALGSIVVKPNTTLTLTSATGTNAQNFCLNLTLIDITYDITTATGATVSGLPDGVTGSYANGVFTISGFPTASGTFNYTITPTGGCGTATATGSIVVKPISTLTLTSATGTDAQTLCINSAITDIQYTVGNATGASITGLPNGVTGTYSNGVFTISGTPTESGTFDYILTPSNGCGTVAALGSIVVKPNTTLTLTSATGTNAQNFCLNLTLIDITYDITTATGATVSGLPDGVTGSYANGVFTISGFPTASGTFNYTITPTGGCGTATATGSIVVKPISTLTLTSATGTEAQTLCINSAITDIQYTVGNATGASITGLPNGVSGAFANGVFTISGTPTESGTFDYTLTPSNGCGTVAALGSIVVKPNTTLTLTSATGTNAQNICLTNAIVDIKYNVVSASGATVTGLPAGVSATFANNMITISGTPTATGTFNYTITPSGACGTATATGSIVINNCQVEWANLQAPGTASINVGQSVTVTGQVYKTGVTPGTGQGANITAWIGYSTTNTDPSTWTNWVAATYNSAYTGFSNDEYKATIGASLPAGTYYIASRFQSVTAPYVYGGYSTTGGGFWDGSTFVNGVLTISCNVATPTGSTTQTFVEGHTVADIMVTTLSGATVNWYASAADAAAGTNAIPTTTVLANNTTYYVTQTVGSCTSTALAVTITVTLKNDSFDSKAFTYYPNPTFDVLHLNYSNAITKVKVTNMIGQEVISIYPNATTAQLDLSSYAAGTYFVEVTADTVSKTVKVIKK
ncbi:Protein of unknown function precursor; putative adhesin [Flavobacterium branchiophilum FL-15]|uniref:Ig-like domain-containing protein n=1 Tax=Flavobacterium branchiophilum (strain FL-15) TaxID=1034807 RepID=G2Z6R1_FLABF|nr:Protein of unknown function precursor; putative adhesin [Flavobacterium branchiophilum FL-15]